MTYPDFGRLLAYLAVPLALGLTALGCGGEPDAEAESQEGALGAICHGNGDPPADLRSACCYDPSRERTPADDDGDGLWERCENALAEKYAPIVYHSSDESNLPANVDWFLGRTTLNFYDDGCWPDYFARVKNAPSQQDLLTWTKRGGCGSDDTVASNGTWAPRKQRTFFLSDVASGDRAGLRDSRQWTTYVHAYANDIGGITVQYWRMYAYNDAANNHGGDWEGQFVVLDASLRPSRAVLMGHSDIEDWAASDMVWEGDHMRVFSEGGGHATRRDGSGIDANGCAPLTDCNIDVDNPATFIRQETWPGGKVSWPGGQVTSTGHLLNVGEKLRPLNGQVFLQYSGIWGSPGTHYGWSGYWGPAFNETQRQGNVHTAWCWKRYNAPAGECSAQSHSR